MAVMALAFQANLNAQTYYSDLPIERRMLFNYWLDNGTMIDCGDYGSWTHLDTSSPGRTAAMKALLDGKDHVFKKGTKELWVVRDVRLGTYSMTAGAPYIDPQYYTINGNSYTNWQANFHNAVGAELETPICEEGIGYLYFDALNTMTKDPVAIPIRIDFATNKVAVSGNYLPITSNTGTLKWNTLTEISVGTDGVLHYKGRVQITDPVKLRITRTAKTGNSTVVGDLLVLDNICLSYPTPPVTVTDPVATKVAALPTSARVVCTISNRNSGVGTDHDNRTATLFYKSFDETVYQQAEMAYVVGTGDGSGNDETWDAVIEFPKGEETEKIDYYVVVSVYNTNRYRPVDYTLRGVTAWETEDGAEPPETVQSNVKMTDVSGWIVSQITSKLPLDRLILFNQWEETNPDTGDVELIDMGDYFGGGWTHLDKTSPGRTQALKALLDGTNHVFSSGEQTLWDARGVFLGTKSYSAGADALTPQTYTFAGQTITNRQAVLTNTDAPMLISPCYTNGIGTIYFDAINNENKFTIDFEVQIATNMIDLATLWPTNVMFATEQEWEGIDETTGLPVTHHLAYNWVPLTTNTVDFGTSGQIFRYQKKLLYRDLIRFRIVRTSEKVSDSLSESCLSIDNIQVSPPPADVRIEPDEVTFVPPYPAIGEPFNIRCRVSNVDMTVPTTHEKRAVYVYYRWRYLDQQVNDFTPMLM
ncbi:MAG: hypothetical protein J6334_02950, partial [Kiritimatiellae bacterium]|nr:hypothetical protein [Kiritimatiellia bacterium]